MSVKGFRINNQIHKYAYPALEDLPEIYDTLAAFATDTASGAIAAFPDGADDIPVKDLSVAIEPVQDLHGYSNPWPAGGGKNLFDASTFQTKTQNGVTCVNNGDGSFTINGTATGTNDTFFNIFSNQFSADAGGTPLPSAQYRLTGMPAGAGSSAFYFYTTPAYNGDRGNGQTFTNTITGGSIYIKSGTTVDNVTIWPMIRLAANGDDTFAPYANICPISGWTGATVTRTGKNLCDLSAFAFDDSAYIHSHAPSGDAKPFIDFLADHIGETFILSGKTTGTASGVSIGQIRLYAGDVLLIIVSPNIAFPVPNVDFSTVTTVYCYGSTSGASFSDIQLELGSTDHDYHAYSGNTYFITFPSEAGTVYGGTLDVTTGKLTVDRAMVDMGTLTWVYYTTYAFFMSSSLTDRKIGVENMVSDLFKTEAGSWSGTPKANAIWGNGSNASIYVQYPLTTVEDFLALVTGHQLCYELSTPITYDLTPTEVTTLLGTNNIWADTGDSSVEYRADTKLYVDKKIAALVTAN